MKNFIKLVKTIQKKESPDKTLIKLSYSEIKNNNKMTKLERMSRLVNLAEMLYPRSYVSIHPKTGQIIAHHKDFNRVVDISRKKYPNEYIAIGHKTPDTFHGIASLI